MKLLKHVAEKHYKVEGIFLNEKSEDNNGALVIHKQGEHEEEKEGDQDSSFVFKESMLHEFL